MKHSLVELTEAYNTCEEFKEYVNKNSKCYRMLPEDCLKLVIVQNYYDYLVSEHRA